MKILLVEDDGPLGMALVRVLRQQGFPTVWVRSIADAQRQLREDCFELALLDIVLPDGSGLDFLSSMRAAGDKRLVLMLTARDTVADRVAGLDGGADDYMPKPFAVDELLSRIRALQRRRNEHRTAVWKLGALELDTSKRKVWLDGSECGLSTREFDILQTLATTPGKVMTRAEIAHSVSLSEGAESNSIDVHIHQLRRKLGSARISTVRGVGYALEPV